MNGNDRDHYENYYADRLWNLLPAIYRAEDSTVLDRNGPLRELVDRLGSQAAILRRSLDRLWADQSIETCDDWVIAYIGDLLATNLVASLDARGQRLDVAKTIYYRRRKGTVAILEEIAADITGWDARVVEFFRRLGRTRHNFDPAIGLPSETDDPTGNRKLQQAQGLVGNLTQTSIGGWADLRNIYGASKTHSAFDEFFYTADVRRGKGQVGWHNIPRLGVFLWRLKSFGLDYTTPVAVKGCPGHYTFDPTGRVFDPTDPLVGVFARSLPAFDPPDRWVSPAEWQLPAPISRSLLELDLQAQEQELYAAIDPTDSTKVRVNSLGVYRKPGSFYELVPAAIPTPETPARPAPQVTIYPKYGRFKILNSQPDENIYVTYHYGFSSTLGAGSYDRRLINTTATATPEPTIEIAGGDSELSAPLTTLAPTGTITLKDSLTYTAISNVGDNTTPIQAVTIQAENRKRPVLRPPATATNPIAWIFYGASGSHLILTGLLISGIDIVLQGEFDSVTLNCCTLDPGHFDSDTNKYVLAADGKVLSASHLLVEAQVNYLTIDRCITGPIATRATGNITQLSISDSIIQAFDSEHTLNLTNGEVRLNRCTLLGGAKVHRLEASECILNDVVKVENPQQGCVRFSAWATGSVLPRPYESVEIPPKEPLFTSRVFGHPGYAQLQSGADVTIKSHTGGGIATILEGAEDGSEMGAFAREKNAIKERSLRIKYEEYMPLGLVPVIVYVT
ncbi:MULTISPECIES: hypothetical protein [unclassified Microcoleus]|uniref:hypothetical protein n=1 Tax=unclassified Microcoleus TaxID=2642155 RepID=UPI002FD5B8C3